MSLLVNKIFYAFNKLDKMFIIPTFAKSRRKKLKYKDFTIISNNCWGGVCYDYFGIQKLSPTVGAYFFAEDYVKFCKRLKHYFSFELEIIPISNSKHYDSIMKMNNSKAIIGRLDDVELVFLHYPDAKTVVEKWNRRVKRINWDRILIKFSYQNECTDDLIKDFLEIKEFPKFCFVTEPITNDKDEIIFKRKKGKETINETINFGWFFNPIKILNERL